MNLAGSPLPSPRLGDTAYRPFTDGQSEGETPALLEQSDPCSWGRYSRDTHRAGVIFAHETQKDDCLLSHLALLYSPFSP